MGIKGLTQVIYYLCPDAQHKQPDFQPFCGKVVAIDASMCIYQSLIKTYIKNVPLDTDSRHLSATFFLNMRLLRAGMRPLYVFGGKPPEQKARMLRVRAQQREKARVQIKQARSKKDFKAAAKYRWQSVKIENHHVEATKDLLKLMGIPYLQAPGEPEAQCAELVRAGIAYATASEDCDSLAYGSPVYLRDFTKRSKPTREIHLDKLLKGIGIDLKGFVDLSILLGCDYCSTISNLGPRKAVKLIRQYKNIETILQNIDTDVYKVPQDWRYNEARYLYENPVVKKCEELEFQWTRPENNTDEITKFLCEKSKLDKAITMKWLEKLKITR